MSKHDDMPTPEEWQLLKAEWTHDYGLRRMEERGVRYEDEVKIRPVPAESNGKGAERDGLSSDVNLQGPAIETASGPVGQSASQPRHPWPSEVARANRHRAEPEVILERDHGHDRGL